MTGINPINTKEAKLKEDLKKGELDNVSSIKIYLYIRERKKRTKNVQAECTASSHAMEEVEDTLEVQEKEFSQVQLETCVSDSTENFHLMQPLVLDEIDVEIFNEITPAMVITNQDTEPADLPTALAEMPVIEATERQARKSS